MKVSIIIPIYNAEVYIKRCLISALNQSYPDIEYICVDDGSSDDSIEKAKNIIKNSPRQKQVVFIAHEGNKGVATSRNTGLNQATGDYIYFLDSDDELPVDAIELLVKAKGTTDADIIIGDFVMTGADKAYFKTIQLQDGLYKNNEILDSFLLMQWPDMTCNKLVRLETIRTNNVFFEKSIIHEDTLWSFMLALKSSLMIILNQTTYIYHIQEQSITQKKTNHNFKSLLIVLEHIISTTTVNGLFNRNFHLRDYLIDYSYYFFKESVRCRKKRSESKDDFFQIKQQLSRIPSIKQGINRQSQIKLILLQFPFLLSFRILKIHSLLKRK